MRECFKYWQRCRKQNDFVRSTWFSHFIQVATSRRVDVFFVNILLVPIGYHVCFIKSNASKQVFLFGFMFSFRSIFYLFSMFQKPFGLLHIRLQDAIFGENIKFQSGSRMTQLHFWVPVAVNLLRTRGAKHSRHEFTPVAPSGKSDRGCAVSMAWTSLTRGLSYQNERQSNKSFVRQHGFHWASDSFNHVVKGFRHAVTSAHVCTKAVFVTQWKFLNRFTRKQCVFLSANDLQLCEAILSTILSRWFFLQIRWAVLWIWHVPFCPNVSHQNTCNHSIVYKC